MRGGAGGKKTVILYAHFDVVGVDEFGALRDAAIARGEGAAILGRA